MTVRPHFTERLNAAMAQTQAAWEPLRKLMYDFDGFITTIPEDTPDPIAWATDEMLRQATLLLPPLFSGLKKVHEITGELLTGDPARDAEMLDALCEAGRAHKQCTIESMQILHHALEKQPLPPPRKLIDLKRHIRSVIKHESHFSTERLSELFDEFLYSIQTSYPEITCHFDEPKVHLKEQIRAIAAAHDVSEEIVAAFTRPHTFFTVQTDCKAQPQDDDEFPLFELSGQIDKSGKLMINRAMDRIGSQATNASGNIVGAFISSLETPPVISHEQLPKISLEFMLHLLAACHTEIRKHFPAIAEAELPAWQRYLEEEAKSITRARFEDAFQSAVAAGESPHDRSLFAEKYNKKGITHPNSR